jgi:transcriptional regulator GlxA family with amidase domain
MTLLSEFDRLGTTSNTDFRVRCILEYARSNLHRDLSLPRLAMVANISVWHVCRLFRNELGVSPGRSVKVLRLKCAADLLVCTSLSVKEVMATVGINDESHFVKDFRRLVGEFPVHYRMRIQRETGNVPFSQGAKNRQ